MLQVSGISKHYGEQVILDRVSFTLNTGDRAGLVGPNGCGKTTLLRIIAGDEGPDAGSVQWTQRDVRVGYLPQALRYNPNSRVQDLFSPQPEHTNQLILQVETLAQRMATATGEQLSSLMTDYEAALKALSVDHQNTPEHLIDQVLAGLDLGQLGLDTPVSHLSGGQKTRLGLARLLVDEPNILLLDEPTNHLDMQAIEWLETYLGSFVGSMLVVSHDRTFLDRLVTQIHELSAEDHLLRTYDGNYSDYVSAKEREQAKLKLAYHEQQERIGRLQGAIGKLDGQAGKIERETIHFHYRKKAKKVARQATVRKRRIQRLLDSEDHIEKPQLHWEMKLEFGDTRRSGQDVLKIEALSKTFGSHMLFQDVNLLLRKNERIALIGPNGAGKSTLLRIIAGHEEPTEGSVGLGANVQLGYLSQEQETLSPELTLLDTIREVTSLGDTEARHFLHYFLFAGDQVFLPVGALSFGERARLALGILVLQGRNLLLLDEPINHLDIPAREQFEQALSHYEGTVLAVVHDRYFINRFATGIWHLAGNNVHRYISLDDLRRGQRHSQGTTTASETS